jgi:hypothetical protein
MISATRFIFKGIPDKAMQLTRPASVLLDMLLNEMKFQGLQQGTKRLQLQDGTEIVCQSVFGQHQITITTAAVKQEKKLGSLEITSLQDKFLIVYQASQFVTRYLVYNPVTNSMQVGNGDDFLSYIKDTVDPWHTSLSGRDFNAVSCGIKENKKYLWVGISGSYYQNKMGPNYIYIKVINRHNLTEVARTGMFEETNLAIHYNGSPTYLDSFSPTHLSIEHNPTTKTYTLWRGGLGNLPSADTTWFTLQQVLTMTDTNIAGHINAVVYATRDDMVAAMPAETVCYAPRAMGKNGKWPYLDPYSNLWEWTVDYNIRDESYDPEIITLAPTLSMEVSGWAWMSGIFYNAEVETILSEAFAARMTVGTVGENLVGMYGAAPIDYYRDYSHFWLWWNELPLYTLAQKYDCHIALAGIDSYWVYKQVHCNYTKYGRQGSYMTPSAMSQGNDFELSEGGKYSIMGYYPIKSSTFVEADTSIHYAHSVDIDSTWWSRLNGYDSRQDPDQVYFSHCPQNGETVTHREAYTGSGNTKTKVIFDFFTSVVPSITFYEHNIVPSSSPPDAPRWDNFNVIIVTDFIPRISHCTGSSTGLGFLFSNSIATFYAKGKTAKVPDLTLEDYGEEDTKLIMLPSSENLRNAAWNNITSFVKDSFHKLYPGEHMADNKIIAIFAI